MRFMIAIAFLALACTTSGPATVPVIGEPAELAPLTGEWTGKYDSRGTGRSGSITFHLTDDPKGAHGDVVLTPRADVVYRNDARHDEPFPGAIVLDIEFVKLAGSEISGRIAPYADPEMPGAMLETTFTGRVSGDRIKGTFVTQSDHGVAPRRGTWQVRRL